DWSSDVCSSDLDVDEELEARPDRSHRAHLLRLRSSQPRPEGRLDRGCQARKLVRRHPPPDAMPPPQADGHPPSVDGRADVEVDAPPSPDATADATPGDAMLKAPVCGNGIS